MKKCMLIIGLLCLSVFSYSESEEGTLVGSLSAQGHILEIWRVDQATQYVVKEKSGHALTGKISGMELATAFPALGELIENGVADHAALDRMLEAPAGVFKEPVPL